MKLKNGGNILVIDLEATCSEDQSISGSDREMIEIGACWMNRQGEILDVFQSFVKPVHRPVLTDFCTKLTTIEQSDVQNAPTFDQVAPLLAQFVAKHAGVDGSWGSWGNYDRIQFEHDSKRHGVPNPVGVLAHTNFKGEFAKRRKIKQVGMMRALSIAGISHTGAHHRALDDALNIAKIVRTLAI